MSFYEPQGWQAPVRQASWEQPPPPSRSGASSSSQRDDGAAFATQFEEVDRAVDNLIKSGKFYQNSGSRRGEHIPQMSSMGPTGRSYNEMGGRMHGGRHSVSEFDPSRSHSASNLQNFYASQRYQSRHNDGEQVMQAKRRMAAQRERELRNYHQEQQYNRSVLAEMSSNKSERSMSPSTLSEEGRRELIARQHRALYGNEGSPFLPSGFSDDGSNRDGPGGHSSVAGGRGASPRAMDPFGMQTAVAQNDGSAPNSATTDTGRGEKPASPSAQGATGFGNFEPPSQQLGKSQTPPNVDETTHSRQISKSTTAPLSGGIAPIGSKPNSQNVPGQPLSKRTTSPLPSSLNYGFGGNEQAGERTGSANSGSNNQKDQPGNGNVGTWGSGSGVWGSSKIGATSVWG